MPFEPLPAEARRHGCVQVPIGAGGEPTGNPDGIRPERVVTEWMAGERMPATGGASIAPSARADVTPLLDPAVPDPSPPVSNPAGWTCDRRSSQG